MERTIAGRLAAVAADAGAQVPRDALRVRLLGNLAASLGVQDETKVVAAALGRGRDRASRAHHLAARMHARTQDDFYPTARVHIGTVVIPAALAVGAPDVHAAVAAGYETFARVSEAYSGEAQRRGWRPTGVFGPIGAAAAAAVGLGLSRDEIAHAIALSSAGCGGTNQSWVDGSGEWLLVVAAAARAGVESALLAASGLAGASAAFEGTAGWGAAFFDDAGAAALSAVLDDGSLRTPAVASKPAPISGIAQAPAAAACALSSHAAGAHSVQVRMNPLELAYPGSRNRGPFRSRSDALMSVALCVLIGLRDGAITYHALTREVSEADRALLNAVELVEDTSLEETEAVVRLERADGAVVEHMAFGSELLYPSWESLIDGDALARRYEISGRDATVLTRLVGSDASAAELMDAVMPQPSTTEEEGTE